MAKVMEGMKGWGQGDGGCEGVAKVMEGVKGWGQGDGGVAKDHDGGCEGVGPR